MGAGGSRVSVGGGGGGGGGEGGLEGAYGGGEIVYSKPPLQTVNFSICWFCSLFD